MVMKLSEKQFTNTYEQCHFHYKIRLINNLLDCMQCSSLDLSVKLETLNFEQRCQ